MRLGQADKSREEKSIRARACLVLRTMMRRRSFFLLRGDELGRDGGRSGGDFAETRWDEEKRTVKQDVSTASTSISIATAVAIVTGGSCQQCIRDQDTIHTYYIYASIY